MLRLYKYMYWTFSEIIEWLDRSLTDWLAAWEYNWL